MSNFITQIQEAEQEAIARVDDAKQKASELLENVQAEAESQNEALLHNVSELAQSQLDKAKEESTRGYNQALSTYASSVQSLENKAQSHFSKVVEASFQAVLTKLNS